MEICIPPWTHLTAMATATFELVPIEIVINTPVYSRSSQQLTLPIVSKYHERTLVLTSLSTLVSLLHPQYPEVAL